MDTLRRLFITLIAISVMCGSVIALLASVDQRDFMLRGYTDPTQTTDLPYRLPRMGVNADLTQYTDIELDQNIILMKDIGVIWVRQIVSWRDVEIAPDNYDWSQWDVIIERFAQEETLHLIPVLVDAPQWRTECDPCREDIFYPPLVSEDFAQFAGDFAARYGDTIDYYQIWDEPNIRTAWGDEDPQPSRYGALLSLSAEAIRRHDPDTYIIAAALAPTSETGPQNINEFTYLEDLYRLGFTQSADAFAAKPYGFSSTPLDRTVNRTMLNFSRIIALREVMVKHGDVHKHLWASNYGWNALPADWQGEPSIWGDVSLNEQVTFTQQAIERANREWPWLAGLIVQNWQPDVTDDDPLWGFSLLDTNGEPKALYDSLASFNQQQLEVARNGLYSVQSPHARYIGTWMFSDKGADIGWIQDSQLTFNFFGEDLALLTRQDDYVTNLYITVNDDPANALPKDINGESYLLLRSDTLNPSLSLDLIAADLERTTHRLQAYADELIPDEAIQRWPIVGYAVSDGDLAAPYDNQVNVAFFASFVAAIAAIVMVSRTNWHFLGIHRAIDASVNLTIGFVTSVALMVSMLLTWGDGTSTLFKREGVQLVLSMLTAGILYINEFGLVIVVCCLLVLLGVIYQRITTGIVLIVFWAPFFLFPVELYTFAFPLVEILLWVTFGAWVLKQISHWGYRRQTTIAQYQTLHYTLNPIDWIIIIWLFLGFLALIWSLRFGVAITEYRTLFVQPALFYLIMRTTTHNKNQIQTLVYTFIAAGIVISGIGIFNWLRGVGIEAEDGLRRLTSVYGSPNNAALFLSRVLPFIIVLGLVKYGKVRYAAILSAAIISTGILLTFSAGAFFVGLPISIIAILLLLYGKRAFLPLVGVGLLALVGLVIAVQIPRFERLTDLSSGTNFYRIRVWQSTVNMIDDHPITGLGLDQFLYEFRGHYIMPDAWEEPELSHPHNIFLDFWSRLGVPGVLLLMGSTIILVRTVLHQRKHSHNLWLVVACAGALVNTVAHGLVDNSIYVIDLAYVTMLIFALLHHTMPKESLMVNSPRHNSQN
jgi:O-antigen ligase